MFGRFSLLEILSRVFVLFCILPIHEFAHAAVANALGDKTAKLSGRLTPNPLAHLDLFGSIMIIIGGFGYAKPVPVNPRNFKNPKYGMALTAAAGPISNLVMGFIFIFLYCLVFAKTTVVKETMPYYIAMFFSFTAQVNVGLAVFNLIPVPPLDGSRILRLIVPDKTYFKFLQYERYISMIMLVLVVVGAFSLPISIVSDFIIDKYLNICASIFGLKVG